MKNIHINARKAQSEQLCAFLVPKFFNPRISFTSENHWKHCICALYCNTLVTNVQLTS
nr:MAG TPA: hypothetical protein [Caudoviricetes sp.]